MKSLLHSNRFLADRKTRETMLRHSVIESSRFEGARGLKLPRFPKGKTAERKP